MILKACTLNNHIVQIYFNGFSNFPLKDVTHQPLVRGSYVLETNGRRFVEVGSFLSDEGGFLLLSGRMLI